MSKKLTQITSSDEKPDFGERIYEQESGNLPPLGPSLQKACLTAKISAKAPNKDGYRI